MMRFSREVVNLERVFQGHRSPRCRHAVANTELRAGGVKARRPRERAGGARRSALYAAEHSSTLSGAMAEANSHVERPPTREQSSGTQRPRNLKGSAPCTFVEKSRQVGGHWRSRITAIGAARLPQKVMGAYRGPPTTDAQRSRGDCRPPVGGSRGVSDPLGQAWGDDRLARGGSLTPRVTIVRFLSPAAKSAAGRWRPFLRRRLTV